MIMQCNKKQKTASNDRKCESILNDIWKTITFHQNKRQMHQPLWNHRKNALEIVWNLSKSASMFMISEQKCVDFYEIEAKAHRFSWGRSKNSLILLKSKDACLDFYASDEKEYRLKCSLIDLIIGPSILMKPEQRCIDLYEFVAKVHPNSEQKYIDF